VSGHVIVIRSARTVHLVNRFDDMLVHFVEIMPIFDRGEHDRSGPYRQPGEGNEYCFLHNASWQMF